MEKIKLIEPIKVDGVVIHEINMRRPKVRDLIMSNKDGLSEAEREINLIANLVELPKDSINDLDLADYLQIQEKLQSFLSAVQKKK